MDLIYLDICGVYIKISFSKTFHPSVENSKKDIVKKIIKILGGFIAQPPKKTHFYINFIEQKREQNTLLLKKRKKEFYMRTFEEVKANKINVYYSVSFYEFMSVLSYLLSQYLSRSTGFIIHTSAILKNKGCYLFLGTSGAGKSTVGKLLKNNFKVLADDTGILKKEGGNFYFYQTPFIERFFYARKGRGRYLVKKAFILKKDKEFKIERIKNKNKVLDEMILFNEINSRLNVRLKEEKNNNNYIKSLLTFVSTFDEFYYLYFAKNGKRLNKLMSDINEN